MVACVQRILCEVLRADVLPPEPGPTSRAGLFVAVAGVALVVLVVVALWRRSRARAPREE